MILISIVTGDEYGFQTNTSTDKHERLRVPRGMLLSKYIRVRMASDFDHSLYQILRIISLIMTLQKIDAGSEGLNGF